MKYLMTILFVAAIVFISIQSHISGKPVLQKHKQYNSFQPGKPWFDNNKQHINAHGGGILFHNSKYYWFGEYKVPGTEGNKAKVGVSCYSSSDLYNWTSEGIVLQVEHDTSSDIQTGCIIERPKVIYNKNTNNFVMWFHLELKGEGYGSARTGLAVSKSITGPYKYIKSFRPNAGYWPVDLKDTSIQSETNNNLEWWTPEWRKAVENGLYVKRDFHKGQMSRDMTLFVDDDGSAYHIYSSEENLTIHIAELTPDYMNFTGKWTRVFPGGHNEAPAVFKRKGKYYMITSGCTGWDPNAARSAVAESIWGPWQPLGNPCVGADSALTFHSQSTFVLPLRGSEDNFIFMADRWNPQDQADSRYVWLPVECKADKPVIRFYDTWDLSIFGINMKHDSEKNDN